MIFFDGKILEVNVYEECAELMDNVRDEIIGGWSAHEPRCFLTRD